MTPWGYIPIDAETYTKNVQSYVSYDDALRDPNNKAFRTTPIHKFNTQYYSGSEAKMYISVGDSESYKLVAETKGISFQLNENILPLYGYASYTPDAWPRGTRIVTGQFVVNMLGVNYLDGILKNNFGTTGQSIRKTTATVDDNNANKNVSDYRNEVSDEEKEALKDAYQWNSSGNARIYDLSTMPFFKEASFTIVLAFRLNKFEVLDSSIMRNIQTLDDVHVFSMTESADTSGRCIEQTYQFMAGDFNRKQSAYLVL